jgi:hypothetical protein
VASSLRLVQGHLPTLRVDGLSSADLAQELVRAALVQQRQQLLPGGRRERVDRLTSACPDGYG